MLGLVDVPLLVFFLPVVAVDGGVAVGTMACVHVIVGAYPFAAVVEMDDPVVHYRLATMARAQMMATRRMIRSQNLPSRSSGLTSFMAASWCA